MSESVLYRLKASNQNVCNLFRKNSTKVSNNGMYIISFCTTNIYDSMDKAKGKYGSAIDSEAMYTIKSGVCTRITNVAISDPHIYVQVQCGSKFGWVYLGEVENVNPNGVGSFKWKGSAPYVNIGTVNYNTIHSIYGLNTTDANKSERYRNLNLNASEVDPEQLVSGTGTENNITNAENAPNTNTAANAMSDSGEINVTTEFAIEINLPFYTNIQDFIDETANSSVAYIKSIEEKGINYRKFRHIFGVPYQFLPTTDCRTLNNFSDDIECAGYEFAEKILSRMPLLYITPGNTAFMGSSKKNQRKELMENLKGALTGEIADDSNLENSLAAMLEEYNGKLYTITPAYAEYFEYVNPLCRSGAIFLEIGDSSFDEVHYSNESKNGGLFNGKCTFANMNWGVNEGLAYVPYEEEETTLAEGVEDEENKESTSEEKVEYEESYLFQILQE